MAIALAVAALLTWQTPAVDPPAGTNGARAGVERIVVDTSEALADWDQRIVRMIAARALALVEERRTGDRHDQWYRQETNGVPILGTEVWRRQEDGRTTDVGGAWFPDVTVPTRPAISAEDARRVLAEAEPGGPGPSLPPDLVVLPKADGTFALVYRARVFTTGALAVHFVDAMTGKLVTVEREPDPPAHPADPPAGAS